MRNEENRKNSSVSGEVTSGLPSFFVIGPPRTGTSWLHRVLLDHTSLPNTVKETRFFDLHFGRGLAWYLRYFEDLRLNGKPRGEVAPTYFVSPEARERIASVVPQARIICIFRHPVERIVSLYQLKKAYGMTQWRFEDAILRDPELLESGKYATHLKYWQQALGTKNVLVTFYDRLRDEPQAYVDSVADFIGIPRFNLSPSHLEFVHSSEGLTSPRFLPGTRIAVMIAEWLKGQHFERLVASMRKSYLKKLFLASGEPFSQISPSISRAVLKIFRREVEELETMTHCDLSAWKSLAFDLKASAIGASAGADGRRSSGNIPTLDEAGIRG
jgi:hypothetical protein